jgi:DNA-binding NtrC family response regulator
MARPRPNVLVVDDDAATRDGLTALLESWGYHALAVSNGQAALQSCNQDLPHAIVSDLMMPGMTGLQFIEALHERVHQVAIIMLTGQATIETAVQAIKLGAYDYLPKPLESPKLRAVLEKGLKQIGFAREANVLRQKLESPLGSYGELIGKSATMRQIYKRLSQIAPTDAAVLVSGESGTGKELVARTLHDLSPRREGTFLALNCAAMAPTLMESELFGHEKGAFTNALERHLGYFEQADGGPFSSTRSPRWRQRFRQSFCESWKKDRCVESEPLQVCPSQSASSLPRAACLLAPSKKENSDKIFFTA